MGLWSRHPLAATLRASLYFSLFITACEVVVAFVAGSSLLEIDSLYSIAETALSGMLVWSTWRLQGPQDKLPDLRIQGFMIRLQSIVMITICVWAVIEGVQGLMHPEERVRFDLCFWFTSIAVIAQAFMTKWLRKRAAALRCPMISIEAYSWAMDTWLDLGFLFSFIIGWRFQDSGVAWAEMLSMYISPVLTICLGLLLVRKPIATLRNGLDVLIPANGANEALAH